MFLKDTTQPDKKRKVRYVIFGLISHLQFGDPQAYNNEEYIYPFRHTFFIP